MKKAFTFLIIGMMIALCSVLIASPGTNRGGTSEIEDPTANNRTEPYYSIERTAYDPKYYETSGSKVWSDATTFAQQIPFGFGHYVSARARVYSKKSIYLYGNFIVSATLNHDWVHPDNQNDGEADEWHEYLHRVAFTNDQDYGDYYDQKDTIEYCLADGYAKAKNARDRSESWTTSVYIPW